MLFHVKFESDIASLLLDAEDESAARTMAEVITDGQPIEAIKSIPVGVFAAEVFTVDDEGNEVDLLPLEEILDLFDALEEESSGESGSLVCGDANDWEGEQVVCSLPPHAEGEHRGTTSTGVALTW